MLSKKKTPIDDMIDDVKTAAAAIGEAVGVTDPKPYERVVPVPQVDVYSELPFALVEKNGERIAAQTVPARRKAIGEPDKRLTAPTKASVSNTTTNTK
jgi:hypothetical protein